MATTTSTTRTPDPDRHTATTRSTITRQGTERGEPVTTDFRTETVTTNPGENLPQRIGGLLWLPMFLMALMGWGVAIVLAIIEASTDRGDVGTLQTLGHLVPGFMFIGFLGVFSAITFAIARILGVFRWGGAEVQIATGSDVTILKMPFTAKVMLGLMAMGMMTMLAGIITNFVAAGALDGASASDLVDDASAAAAASGLRRLGVAFYLAGIAAGLGTIIEVLRFQALRIREVAGAR